MSVAETSARLREVLESAGFEDDLERDLFVALQKVVEKHAAKQAAKAEREAAKVLKKAVKTKLPDDELIPDSDMDGDAEFRRLTPPAFELVADEDDDDDGLSDGLSGDEYRMWTEFQPRV